MHAVVITAYTDFAQLERLVARLDNSFFKIFIHVDTRSKAITEEHIQKLHGLGCHVSRVYPVRWGSLTHLLALLHLIEIALQDKDLDYIHLVSGQDYPVCIVEKFKSKCDGKIFIDNGVSAEDFEYLFHFTKFDFLYFLNGGSRILAKIRRLIHPASFSLQRFLKIRRDHFGPFRYAQLRKGLVWMSLPRIAAEYAVRSETARNFLHALRFTAIPEEIYFHSLFLNSDLAPLIAGNNLRYQDWGRKHGSVPAILDGDDVEKVLASGALFARKVNSQYSSGFVEGVDARVFGEATTAR